MRRGIQHAAPVEVAGFCVSHRPRIHGRDHPSDHFADDHLVISCPNVLAEPALQVRERIRKDRRAAEARLPRNARKLVHGRSGAEVSRKVELSAQRRQTAVSRKARGLAVI